MLSKIEVEQGAQLRVWTVETRAVGASLVSGPCAPFSPSRRGQKWYRAQLKSQHATPDESFSNSQEAGAERGEARSGTEGHGKQSSSP